MKPKHYKLWIRKLARNPEAIMDAQSDNFMLMVHVGTEVGATHLFVEMMDRWAKRSRAQFLEEWCEE